MEFNAHDTTPYKGHVYYSNSVGGWFEGTVDCYHREDNRAAFAGDITAGTYAGSKFQVDVKDNDPDVLRVRASSDLYDCTLSNSYPGTVTEGDIKIHEIPENAPLPAEIFVLDTHEEEKKVSLTVDNDRVECPNADYDNIPDAVNAAYPGDTIKVCAGTYAGATLSKEVHLEGEDLPIINDGPNSHSFLRAGFLLDPGNATGTSIKGFRFEGAQQFGYTDDGKLDFPIFSRGSDNVTVKDNSMYDSLQAITNWNGSGWTIKDNYIEDLWTLNGGGIGILIGRNDGGSSTGNTVKDNTIEGTLMVWESDGGGYNGTGIVLYSDYRYLVPGGGEIKEGTVKDNKVELTSDTPGKVDVFAFEATDTRDDSEADPYPVISGNVIKDNDFTGSANEYDFTPDELIKENTYKENLY